MGFLVKDVMNPKILATRAESTLVEASKMMDSYKIGSLLVVEEKKTVGIVTSTDILKAVSSGMDLESTNVSEIMSKNLVTVDANETLEKAVELMMQNKIKKIPVVKDGEIVGIITASDIIVVEPRMIENIANMLSMKIPDYKGG